MNIFLQKILSTLYGLFVVAVTTYLVGSSVSWLINFFDGTDFETVRLRKINQLKNKDSGENKEKNETKKD